MIDYQALKTLSEMAITSEYFLQATIDKKGSVLSSDSGVGPVPTLFDQKSSPLSFQDCFLASDWSKFENQRVKAWRNSQQSFVVILQKIVYPERETIATKWEFFFLTEDFGTCLGIGHPLSGKNPYDMGLGEYFDESNLQSNYLLSSLLEDKLLGFWEFDYTKSIQAMSQGLAQMLGYKTEELTSEKVSIAKHVHPEDLPLIETHLNTHLKSPGTLPFKCEFRIQSKGNQTRWVYCFGKTTEWDADGNPLILHGCMLDVTERKKQALWMKEHQHFLKNLVFDQSHSIRSKVANLLGLFEIADLEQDTEEIKRLIQVMHKETTMLDTILKKSIRENVQQNRSLGNQNMSSDLI